MEVNSRSGRRLAPHFPRIEFGPLFYIAVLCQGGDGAIYLCSSHVLLFHLGLCGSRTRLGHPINTACCLPPLSLNPRSEVTAQMVRPLSCRIQAKHGRLSRSRRMAAKPSNELATWEGPSGRVPGRPAGSTGHPSHQLVQSTHPSVFIPGLSQQIWPPSSTGLCSLPGISCLLQG